MRQPFRRSATRVQHQTQLARIRLICRHQIREDRGGGSLERGTAE
jgi:hypothetical protein